MHSALQTRILIIFIAKHTQRHTKIESHFNCKTIMLWIPNTTDILEKQDIYSLYEEKKAFPMNLIAYLLMQCLWWWNEITNNREKKGKLSYSCTFFFLHHLKNTAKGYWNSTQIMYYFHFNCCYKDHICMYLLYKNSSKPIKEQHDKNFLLWSKKFFLALFQKNTTKFSFLNTQNEFYS